MLLAGEHSDVLEKEGRDLVSLVASGYPRSTLFRDDEINLVLKALNNKQSVLLVGAEGVGRRAVILGVASRLFDTGKTRVVEFPTSQIFVGTKYIGEWETKAHEIALAAKNTSSILFFNDIWNIPTAGKTSSSEASLLDAYRQNIRSGEIQLLGKLTQEQYQDIKIVPEFTSLFEIVKIPQLASDKIEKIINAEASRLSIDLDAACFSRLSELCRQYLPESPGPGPSLGLLNQVRDYKNEKEGIGESERVTPSFIEKVFSIYSGLPRFITSLNATISLSEIRSWFRDRLVGQESAIDAVVEMIVLFKARLNDPNRPIGTFLFVGPTGVGKTELARLLATFLFGSPGRLLRFDMSEFKDHHSFEILIGDPHRKEQKARLLDPVRVQPFQVVLFDELEKGHPNVWNLMLQLLDEGRLSPPHGQVVNFRNTIIIATSNVGAKEASNRGIGFAARQDSEFKSEQIRGALELTFRPEFINRFQHITFFHALSQRQTAKIARHELQHILKREGITGRGLIIDVTDSVIDYVVDKGYDHRYGARALKRQVQRLVVMPIATLFLERVVDPGSIINILLRGDKIKINIVETAESRANRNTRKLEGTVETRLNAREKIGDAINNHIITFEKLCDEVGEEKLRSDLEQLDRIRTEPEFWKDSTRAEYIIRQGDQIFQKITRLDSLRRQAQELQKAFGKADTQKELQALHCDAQRAEKNLNTAKLELVQIGEKGECDALIEITPLGDSVTARNLLYETYQKWAQYRGMQLNIIFEPINDEQSIILGIQGDYSYGMLRLEAGHHRVREKGQNNSVARVRVIPWLDISTDVCLVNQRALKKKGQLGGRIRSRVEVDGGGPVLQNDRSLSENRELAPTVAASWIKEIDVNSEVVRRYDLKPFLVRDYMTDTTSGRAGTLNPEKFDRLLCSRISISSNAHAA